MYDFVKLSLKDRHLSDHLLQHPLLDFTTSLNVKTGEVRDDVYEATYKNLTFKVFLSGRLQITGSIHKFYNKGLHNHNDFGLPEVREVVAEFLYLFGIRPERLRIENLEFGVNVELPFCSNELLSHLVSFKGKAFSRLRTFGPGNGREVYFTQYGIKIYNKGLQFNLPTNLLRIEKKISKMEKLAKEPLYLIDLCTEALAEKCLKDLLECFDQLIITESLDLSKLSKADRHTYDRGSNPLAWEVMSRRQRYNHKTKFNAIIDEFGTKRFKPTIYSLTLKKGQDLINTRSKNVARLSLL